MELVSFNVTELACSCAYIQAMNAI